MSELKPGIHGETNGLDYILVGDYFIPVIELPEHDDRPIGKWGWMHRTYLKENNRIRHTDLILTGKLHTYIAELNEQEQEHYLLIAKQMAKAEGVADDLKRRSHLDWVRAMNGVASRAEEIVKSEIIYV